MIWVMTVAAIALALLCAVNNAELKALDKRMERLEKVARQLGHAPKV